MICPGCDKEVGYDLIPVSVNPESIHVCYDCLSPTLQKQWDNFLKNSNQQALVSGSSKVKTSANPNPSNVPHPDNSVKHD